jgi:hypothetical protein
MGKCEGGEPRFESSAQGFTIVDSLRPGIVLTTRELQAMFLTSGRVANENSQGN